MHPMSAKDSLKGGKHSGLSHALSNPSVSRRLQQKTLCKLLESCLLTSRVSTLWQRMSKLRPCPTNNFIAT